MTDSAALSALFLAAFLAATVLLAQSEALLVALIVAGDIPVPLLVAVAGAGNVLGSLVNYALGRAIERLRGHRWFSVSPDAFARAEAWYRRWGRWSLLLSWLPVVGDPLTVVAGALREPLPSFLILVTVGKLGRYVALAAGTAGFMA